MEYKAIVFDFGGVLVTNGNNSKGDLMQQIADVMEVTVDEFRSEYFNHNHITNVEGKPWIEACLSAARTFGISKETENRIREIQIAFNNNRQLNQQLIQIIDSLKQTGFTIAILSNYTSELRKDLSTLGVSELFDYVFVSGEMGVQKPDPRVFTTVCEKLSIKPKEMIFIDDTRKSLETADEVGYTPILFESNEQLVARLQELEILPR